MTERLPDSGETSWADVLGAGDGSGGFLRVAHNDDGTQKFPGSSYLRAIGTITGAPLASGASGDISWTLDDVEGSDIAINGGDDTLIDILTTGWYQITATVISLPVSLTGTDSFQQNYFEILTPTGVGAKPFWDWAVSMVLAANNEAAGVITTEIHEKAAADQIQVTASNTMTLGGTWDIVDTVLGIVRMA